MADLAVPRCSRRLLAPIVALLLTAWLLPLAGCLHHKPEINVPIEQNAAAQYNFAVKYRDDANLPLILDKKKMMFSRSVVRENFKKVADYFPQDRKYTPLAKLELIEIDAGLDEKRVEPSTRQEHAALRELDRLAREYPEFTFVQAKTLYDQGLIYKRMGDFAQAQDRFKLLRDRYTGNPDAIIANLAQRAAYYYNKTYVTNE